MNDSDIMQEGGAAPSIEVEDAQQYDES